MNQYRELQEYISEYRIIQKSIKRKDLLSKKNLLNLLPIGVFDILIQKQIINQKLEGQDKIKYIIFQRLLSSGYTGSYEISVGMSNAKLYLDEQIVYEYWKPNFIYGDIDETMEEVKKVLSKKYVRVEEYELLRLKQQLLLDDWTLFVEILKREAKELAQSVMASDLLLDDEIQIVYGNYMDKLQIAYRIKTYNEEENNG